MMYYHDNNFITIPEDFGKWIASSQKKPEAKPVEYAFKDEVDYLKRIVNKHDVDIDHCLQEIEVNKKDCEQMYQSIDMLKNDVRQLIQMGNYLYEKVESAPNAAKRKRRVTICAGGQTVDIKRV